jgi:hypothetical protein
MMQVRDRAQLERAELDAVLRSGILNRAPNLASFLRYVCDRYFEGQADQIKEYCIAVEALGRAADFDQKRDSIVRVEAHRLRRRLAEYYRGPGASHPVHIVIPNGQYAPQFVEVNPAEDPDQSLKSSPQPPSTKLIPVEVLSPLSTLDPSSSNVLDLKSSRTNKANRWAAFAFLALLVAGIFSVWSISHKHKQAAVPYSEIWKGPSGDPVSGDFRLLAGVHGSPFSDRQGRIWGPDAYYTGGRSTAISSDRPFQAVPAPGFLKAKREGQFRYDIPLRQGTYELHLYFAETDYGYGNPAGGGETSRLFRISINHQLVLNEFDVLAEAAAPNRLHERVFKDVHPAPDGKLHLEFNPTTGPAFLNAIEVLPSLSGRIRPVRIVAQENSVTDGAGQVWLADRFSTGGHLVVRRDSVTTERDKPLFEGERYGNFTYRIPLAAGKYKLTLHFAETWFGGAASGQPAVGSRLFNVFANGVSLLRAFDIAKEAGGPNRAIEKVFNGVEPNAQGMLVLEFVPIRNYACVNAIEVVGEQ